ncbi:heavy metal-associated domain-containing protein [Flavobacteriaceae bacterium SZ-1-7]|uniref:heavy-metal-associated domain-containing protein n=1 Tax=Tamlana sedimenti TaxID=3134126 RepID=UPI003121CCF0
MTTTLEVQNLKCGGCANSIKEKLSLLPNVKDISVDVANSLVSFSSDEESTVATVKSLLSKIGYPVTGNQNPLTTKAKSFVSCAVGRMKS